MMKRFFRYLLRVILAAVLLAAVGVVVINLYMVIRTQEYIYGENTGLNDEKAAGILVLGCAVRENAEPSPMLADRMEKAVELFQKGYASSMMVSGDHRVDSYNEVGVMSAIAVKAGVPEEYVYPDHMGLSTYDSVVHALERYGNQKVFIVSQGYHLYRAVYLARGLGMDAYGVPAEDRHYAGQLLREFREAAARVKDFFYMILRPQEA